MTLPVPTFARTAATCSSMIDSMVQPPLQPARSWRNRCSTAIPCGVCTTSGCHCTPQILRSRHSSAATGASGVLAVAVKPGGGTVTASKWLIHTSCSWGRPSSSSLCTPSARVTLARPYSPRRPRPTVPPSCWAISCTP